MTDWESDPELKALRDDFIASFVKRRALLSPIIKNFQNLGKQNQGSLDSTDPSVCEFHSIAHNLAGIASTYGFDLIGKVSIEIDDYISRQRGPVPVKKLINFSIQLDQALQSA